MAWHRYKPALYSILTGEPKPAVLDAFRETAQFWRYPYCANFLNFAIVKYVRFNCKLKGHCVLEPLTSKTLITQCITHIVLSLYYITKSDSELVLVYECFCRNEGQLIRIFEELCNHDQLLQSLQCENVWENISPVLYRKRLYIIKRFMNSLPCSVKQILPRFC